MVEVSEARKTELLNTVKGFKQRRMGAEVARGFAPFGQKTCTTTLWLYRISTSGITSFAEVELSQEEFDFLLANGLREAPSSFNLPAGQKTLEFYKKHYGVE